MAYAHPPPLELAAKRLEGRVVFVTGASSGIGAAAVRRFAEEGALAIATARRKDRIEALAGELRDEGLKADAIVCDVRDEDSIAAAIAETVRRHGHLDGAFNNAGVGGAHVPLTEVPAEKFDAVIATNLRGVFLCMKHEIRAMLEAGRGAIVNTSSIGGLVGVPQNSDYAASKFGLEGLTRCAALEFAGRNIRVNAIAPGPTDSEMFGRWMPTEDVREELAARFPLNYIAHPDDMARAALFLLSDESRWTTGIVLPCEGGLSAG